MDTSIRLYNSNSRLRSTLNAEAPSYTTRPLQDEEDGRAEVSLDEGERVTDTISTQSASALEEPAQRVDVADFEAIFVRFQGPITNFIYHLIGNGTVVQPKALSAWLYRIASNTTTDTLRRRRLISWLPLSLFNEDRGIGAGVVSEAGGASPENFSSNNEDGEGRSSSITAMYERGGYDGGRFENRVADREIVERLFQQLPPKYAICLWLYENDGRSCAEIAAQLNISASAVKMRLMRARERFAALYKQEVGDISEL